MVLLIIGLCFNLVYSIVPPKYGQFNSEFARLIPEIQKSYTSGNLLKVLKAWYQEKQFAQLNRQGTKIYTDTLAMNIPVLMGRFAEDNSYIVDAPTQMQQQLFDGPWPTMTMREFYLENSYGQFSLAGTVYGWVEVANPESYYAPNNAGLFIVELLDSLDSYVNFADYDNDGDGFVESIIVIHSTIGAEYGNNSHIWSHRWSLSGAGYGIYVTNDVNSNGIQVKVNDYSIQGSKTFGGGLERIGVFCHEFGHLLGLPDLYDTDYSSEGIGDWGIMSGGSWNEPESPAHFCVWSKEALGWLEPIVVEENTEFVNIMPVEEYPVAYKLWYEGVVSPYTSPFGAGLNLGRQYFLVENRQKIGSDMHLHESGLLVWHIDNTINNNRDENHKLVDLEEADGFNDLDYNVNSGDAGDPFPGMTMNTLFDLSSNPNSLAYNGNDTKVAISDIFNDISGIYANLGVGIIKYEYLSINFDDIAGNGNGIFDPGEEVHLWIEVRNNTAAMANNMILELTSASAHVSISGSPVSLGNIASGDSANNNLTPFVLSISSTAPALTENLQLRLTIDGQYEKLLPVYLVIGIPEFLVIDQDINRLSISNFRHLLDTYQYDYQLINPNTDQSFKWRFAQRKIIALIGGDNYLALSDSSLQDSLMTWMDGNKNLLIMSPNAASALDSSVFARDFLHIQYVNPTTTILLKGEAADPLGFNGAFVFLENGSYEMVSPVNSSIASLKFSGTPNGGLIHYQDSTQNKIVFLSFDLRKIRSNSPTSQDQILSGIINWFGFLTPLRSTEPSWQVTDYILLPNFPNPFNPETAIRFYNPSMNKNLRLMVFNSLGQKVMIFDKRNIHRGWNEIKWDGRNSSGVEVASGIYYLLLQDQDVSLSRKMILLR
jgi:M6 family metalloprotease-like protein